MLQRLTGGKKPQFHFQLVINDLTNIPQLSGYCYIELLIRNSTQQLLKHHIRKSKLVDSDDEEASESHDKTSGSVTGSNVKAVTSKHKIHNFKCTFNYNLSCNLKFPFKKSENLIGNKYLSMTVFYINQENDEITTIGKTDVNLTEYLNFKDPITSKYLLKDAKVNSILSLTIGLKELPANMDFHTQLQINDLSTPALHGTVANSLSKDALTTRETSFNLPQFDRKKIFTGLNEVIVKDTPEDLPKLDSGSSAKPMSQSASETSSTKQTIKSKLSGSKTTKSDSDKSKSKSNNSIANGKQDTTSAVSHTNHQQSNVIMDPIVSGLYRKILESTWDPELHPLLDYTPEKCINDIFDNIDNPQGWAPNISKKFGTWSDEEDDDDDNVKDLNGLISETKLRDDLRSWTVEVKQ